MRVEESHRLMRERKPIGRKEGPSSKVGKPVRGGRTPQGARSVGGDGSALRSRLSHGQLPQPLLVLILKLSDASLLEWGSHRSPIEKNCCSKQRMSS